MGPEIQKAMLEGVAAHKQGNLQEAEKFYRAILQVQPFHPDANHNLGMIALSQDRADIAITFFKKALEADPKVEQFWLSYIDALIKNRQFKRAKLIVKRARKKGIHNDKLESLKKHLELKSREGGADSVVPQHQQAKKLVDFYQAGNFSRAEKLARSLIKEYPNDQLSWKVLV